MASNKWGISCTSWHASISFEDNSTIFLMFHVSWVNTHYPMVNPCKSLLTYQLPIFVLQHVFYLSHYLVVLGIHPAWLLFTYQCHDLEWSIEIFCLKQDINLEDAAEDVGSCDSEYEHLTSSSLSGDNESQSKRKDVLMVYATVSIFLLPWTSLIIMCQAIGWIILPLQISLACAKVIGFFILDSLASHGLCF